MPRGTAKKYLDYKNEVRRTATEFDVDRGLVDSAFAINEATGREVIDMRDLLFVAAMFGKANATA